MLFRSEAPLRPLAVRFGVGLPAQERQVPEEVLVVVERALDLLEPCEVRSTAVAGRRAPSWLGSGGQVERAREAVEELAAPAQDLDHAGRDRAIRGELAGDEPADARTRGEG